jgi:hypothetical protein
MRPERRPGSPLLWVLAGLLLTVGLVVLFRARSASAPGTTAVAGAATPLPEATVAAAPTSAPAVGPSPAAAPPTAVPTAAPPPPTAAPRPRSAAKAPGPAAKPAPAAPPPASSRDNSRQHWVDRAARDAQRLAGDRKTKYAVQLELVCEVPSLVDAFQHDRGGNMWIAATQYQDRTCFRVLWGRYPTIEAAKRGVSGAPKFFTTATNRPAVTAVR